MKILIQCSNIDKQYGSNVLFRGATAAFAQGQKIGVIGRNGVGKSTLCRMILGEEEPDRGDIVTSPDLRLGYLAQHDAYRLDETPLEFLMRQTGRADWECGKIAGRFQIKNSMLNDTPISEFSGGYRTRIKLAAMLLEDPNLLILDEPTNFLDLSTVILLERFLQEFQGGYLLVSHDREFLKRTCDNTLEVDRGNMTLFPGDIEMYLAWRGEHQALIERQNQNVELRRKQLQLFVDRFRAKNTKAKQAQSKMKQINKLQTISIEHPIRAARIRLPDVDIRKGLAVACEGLAIGYPNQTVARDIHLTIDRGAHVAVLGDNGQGKTTFLRTIAGDLEPLDGACRWGHKQVSSYYAQHVYATLDEDMDVYTCLQRNADPTLSRQEILNMAGSFLFSGSDVDKPVAVLSGGERARLCLAGLLLARKPVLLLDEPTNHLDFETVEALGAALRKYAGTIFFVCHDRTFVNLVATQILDIRDGHISLYSGSYEEYVYHLELDAQSASDPAPSQQNGEASEVSPAKSEWQRRKELRSQNNRFKKQLKNVETRVAELEREKTAIVNSFDSDPASYTVEKNNRLQEVTALLETEESTWLGLQHDMENLKMEMPE